MTGRYEARPDDPTRPATAELQGHEYTYDHRCVRIVNGEVCYRGEDDPVHQKPTTAACRFCAGDEDLADYCQHSPAEVALAEAIGRAVHGDGYTDEHGAFFLWAEDPANVIACLGEQPSWTVTTNPARYDMTLIVNGVMFAIDPNEEGPGIARPQPPAFVCAHCGESWAEVTDVGCHVLDWNGEGVEVECNECFEVQTVAPWWTQEAANV